MLHLVLKALVMILPITTIITFSSQKPAHADLIVCNRTYRIIKFSYAYPRESSNGIFGYNDPRILNRGWEARGWRNIYPGECKTVYSGTLKPFSSFSYYARSREGRRWAGDRLWCVSKYYNFRHGKDAQGNCNNFPYYRWDLTVVGFREVNLDGKRNFTLNLD